MKILVPYHLDQSAVWQDNDLIAKSAVSRTCIEDYPGRFSGVAAKLRYC
jgi:hypothetical protein